MPQKRLKLGVGLSKDFTRQTPNADGTVGSQFTLADTITSSVWVGDSEAVLATPTVVWGSSNVTPLLGAPLSLWTLQFNGTDTMNLAPGLYRCQVSANHGGRVALMFDGLLDLISTAATATDGDLVSYTYVETLLNPLRLKESEREMIGMLKAEASDAVRKFCGQRDFTRQTYSEEYSAELNGYVALNQMPVNNVLRIRGYLQTAMIVTANNPSFSSAFVQWTTSGDWATGTLTYTGINLVSYSSGAITQTPFLFANYGTISALSTAVNGVPGWQSGIQGNLGTFASTDLAAASNGTAQGAMSDDGCELLVYSEDLTTTKINNGTGMLWTGRARIASAFGGRWGEDGGDLADMDSPPVGRVRVDYDAGFDVIPTPVQLACAELVKATIERLRTDSMKKLNSMGRYKYEITPEMVSDLPYPVRCGLSRWIMSHAK